MTRILMLSLCAWLSAAVAAEFELPGRSGETPAAGPATVKLMVSSTVANDTMQAVLSVEAEERDLTRLADSVRQTVTGAVKAAQESPYIQVTTGAYRTYPIYDRYDPYRFSHWRGVQEIYLTSSQFPALEDVLSRLQGKAFVKAVTFSLSSQERRRAEDKLVEETVKAFLVRADLVQKALKAGGYRVKGLDVSVEPGEQTRRATGRGAVELQ
jgi:predicted secreted protein